MLKNVYEGLNARPKVYLSKEYFREMYPTCVSSIALRVYSFGISVLRHVIFQVFLADKVFVTQMTFELPVLDVFLHYVPFQCVIQDCFLAHITKD